MGQKLKSLQYAALDFWLELDNVIIPLLEIATGKLTELEEGVHRKLQAELSKTQDDDEMWSAQQIAAYEEENARLRRQALGALALDFLCGSMKSTIDRLKRRFNKTRPPDPNGYKGKDWLRRTSKEYLDRFDVDFRRWEVPLLRIEELFLARNAGVHREGEALDEYLAKVNLPRFVDDRREFSVSLHRFREATAEAKRFVSWVVSQMQNVGNGKDRKHRGA